MTLEQRMKLHAEFMCAALGGIIASPRTFTGCEGGMKVRDMACLSKEIANAALAAYEERWKGEKEV